MAAKFLGKVLGSFLQVVAAFLNWCASIYIDTQALLYVLNDAALFRIKAVTQVLENLGMRGSIECESFIISDFALLCAIPLRDGCDLLKEIRQRLRARSVEG